MSARVAAGGGEANTEGLENSIIRETQPSNPSWNKLREHFEKQPLGWTGVGSAGVVVRRPQYRRPHDDSTMHSNFAGGSVRQLFFVETGWMRLNVHGNTVDPDKQSLRLPEIVDKLSATAM